jgi:CRISPR/Cas system CSM-associated protein Csm3 (group 7 of RAMP superfamily)
MPQNEEYWNPYRWVSVREEPVERGTPSYHHQFYGLCGRIECELEALTPLFIGNGRGQFVTSKRDGRQVIPGTSLKGAIRSLAELVGNAAVPSPSHQSDPNHDARHASSGDGTSWQLDVAARTFGYLAGKHSFTGHIRFSDAQLAEGQPVPKPLKQYQVVVGQPKPDHRAFYPDKARRKFYHHHPGATSLRETSMTQSAKVQPVPPGTRFQFRVDFGNLADEELALLLYCLFLEEDVAVTLSKEALGPNAAGPVALKGPLRHKIGGCKPHGGGSAWIRPQRLTLNGDPATRYRGQDARMTFEGTALHQELTRRTANLRARTDVTMQALRSMLLYCPDDPRGREIRYPDRDWFDQEKKSPHKTPLKPTV